MLEGGGNVAGEVAVDVYADTGRLEADFKKARGEAKAFDKDMGDVKKGVAETAKEFKNADKAVEELARAYNPLHAALRRYIIDLDKINRLEAAGVFSKQEALDYTRRATAAFNEAGRAQSNLAAFTEKAKTQMKLFAVAALTAAAVGGVALVKASIEQAKAVKDTAASLGISAEELQRWQYVASQSGVEASELERGFEGLQRAVGRAASGAKRESALFALLGIELKGASGEAKSVAQIMPEVADALLRIEDANQRAAVAQILFGESANEMLPALAGGSARINELSAAAEELGIVLSSEQIAKLDEAGQKMEAVKQILMARIAATVAENADAILELSDRLLQLGTAAINAFNGLAKLADSPIGQFVDKIIFATNPLARFIDLLGRLGSAGGQTEGGALGRGFAQATAIAERARGLATGPLIDASGFLKPAGPRGRKGPDLAARAERERVKRLRAEIAFENELAGMNAEILRLAKTMVGNAEDRAKISTALLDMEKQRFARTLQLEGPEGTKKYTAAQVELLRTKEMEVDGAKRRMIEIDRLEETRRDENSIAAARIENDRDLLEGERDLARTNKRMLELDRELLDLQFDLERITLQEVIDSGKSSDAAKKIAEERLRILDLLKDQSVESLERLYQGPVEDFFDTVELSADQVEEAMERFRAARLEEQRARAVQFADDVAAAFGNLARSVARLEDPLDIAIALLTDLASIFTEEVLVRPFQDLARQKIGGPLAERVVGAPAGPEGLWIKQMGEASLQAAIALDQLRLAASRTSAGFNVEVLPGVSSLGTASGESAAAMKAQTGAVNQFGTGLLQVLQSLSAGAGGGAGGFLSFALSLAGAVAGSVAGPRADLVGSVAGAMDANPGLFHDGGVIGPSGRPVRRRLRPGEVNITARVGERVIPEGPARNFESELDMISAGRLPAISAIAPVSRQTVDARTFSPKFGDIHVHGVRDERTARRTGKQIAAEINRSTARAAQQGIRRE